MRTALIEFNDPPLVIQRQAFPGGLDSVHPIQAPNLLLAAEMANLGDRIFAKIGRHDLVEDARSDFVGCYCGNVIAWVQPPNIFEFKNSLQSLNILLLYRPKQTVLRVLAREY